jgi:hypothetical protein
MPIILDQRNTNDRRNGGILSEFAIRRKPIC